MFEKGEYIVYGRSGVCRIEDITHLNISGADQKKLYYVLVPLHSRGSRIYFPVDKKDVNARRLITEQEAQTLLEEIRNIPQIGVGNEKLREESYKQALNSCDYRQWAAIIKTLYLRKQERLSQGKKVAAMDERYLKLAEESLYGELAFVMGREKEEMESFMTAYMERKEETGCC